eukprot:GILJ01006784.1.p1 GENE.GILJ01006784.1~~GILJ01006784.1.p1  ORF type:complete len:558 (+),score=37.17 GILJ01006784.1:14-1687(+)
MMMTTTPLSPQSRPVQSGLRAWWTRIKSIEGLTDTKSIEGFHAEANTETFHRVLGAKDLVFFGLGAIIGAGIFVITGHTAAEYAGPGIVLSFVISGCGCAFAGLCYAEFAALIPVMGSAYTYAYASLGQFAAWVIGWDLMLEYLFSAATVAVGWSGYFVSILNDMGITFPAALCNAPFDDGVDGWKITGSVVNVPAMFIIAVLTILMARGVHHSNTVNTVMVCVKVVVIALFLCAGVFFVQSENWHPFIPENTGSFGSFGFSGVMRASGVLFFAYIGFDSVSCMAQETRNPQRDMPIGILGSLVISSTLYILVGLVLTGIVPYHLLSVPAPVAFAIDYAGSQLRWIRPFVKLGALAGLSSVILVTLMGQPRILASMANDGLLPPLFAQVHTTYKTPYKASIITGACAMVIAGLFPIGILGELVSIGTLFAFIIVCASVLLLRKTRPNLERPFRTPWVPYVPIGGILFAGAQMFSLPPSTWVRLIIWMAIGLAIYFYYGRTNSLAMRRAATAAEIEVELTNDNTRLIALTDTSSSSWAPSGSLSPSSASESPAARSHT